MKMEQVQPEEESKEGGKPRKEHVAEKERKTMEGNEGSQPFMRIRKRLPFIYITPFVSVQFSSVQSVLSDSATL